MRKPALSDKTGLLYRILMYKLARFFSLPSPLPVNLTVSLLYTCNSRCLTCNIWKKKGTPLSSEEYTKIFKNIGRGIMWVTFSGGEPFLREDLAEISSNFYDLCGPSYINIPTNGLLYERIPPMVEEIGRRCSSSELIINISLDHCGEEHDKIRQVTGNFEKTLKTYKALKELTLSNLTVGIHTVISKYNVRDFESIYNNLISLEPDSYIVEKAEEREELDTKRSDITPEIEDYKKAINFLLKEIKKKRFSGVSKLTRSFRRVYYELSKEILIKKRQVIPCYAGLISGQISPDGDVWPCCVRGDSIGNIREENYDFRKIWKGRKAGDIRKSIKRGECYCPLANAAYTNILCHPVSMVKVLASLL